ncbi:TrbC/VirB2 family protein [Altererythrobacter sp.]|uniref:TrbC/VirB2 family protein n=1 Tax=Altererythrobacter sp. TaxID=1872480 RepID=UPI001B2C8AED|nr:TrbC/VirB2 family protein [Altererythrobacter sp.]MBO6609080.1 TrbC/VirB2 family protein [Altererythrobacter sp.]MBO6642619.1 TrbC/VirB2 family protein [Altererythrobacter sp.]MBO6708873.1 TrbC/VirB2 family protein [Altererythrobacter sp.]
MISTIRHYSARIFAALLLLASPSAAFAQNVQQSDDPITVALTWMQGILLGPIATSLAVMAVAGVGFMMLTGRMNWRYGGTVIIGVFIIFGAPRLVASIGGF